MLVSSGRPEIVAVIPSQTQLQFEDAGRARTTSEARSTARRRSHAAQAEFRPARSGVAALTSPAVTCIQLRQTHTWKPQGRKKVALRLASSAKYEFFRSLYDEESDRYSLLIQRAQIFLGICTFFLGGLAFKADASLREAPFCARAAFIGGTAFFAIAFLLVILALSIYTYEGLADPATVIKDGEDKLSDSDFLDYRIADVVVAVERNTSQNNKRAQLLFASVLLMFVGVVLSLLSLIAVALSPSP